MSQEDAPPAKRPAWALGIRVLGGLVMLLVGLVQIAMAAGSSDHVFGSAFVFLGAMMLFPPLLAAERRRRSGK